MNSSNRGRCLDRSQLGGSNIVISVKRVHAPGGDKTFETNKKRLKSSRGMFAYNSITVSSAWELISVSMCYSQGNGANTPCLGLCTVRTISSSLDVSIRDSSFVVCLVIFRGTVMCYL